MRCLSGLVRTISPYLVAGAIGMTGCGGAIAEQETIETRVENICTDKPTPEPGPRVYALSPSFMLNPSGFAVPDVEEADPTSEDIIVEIDGFSMLVRFYAMKDRDLRFATIQETTTEQTLAYVIRDEGLQTRLIDTNLDGKYNLMTYKDTNIFYFLYLIHGHRYRQDRDREDDQRWRHGISRPYAALQR